MKVTTKFKILNIVIVISAIISVLISYELTKGAELHKLNFLHIKHNQLLRDMVLEFSEAQVPSIRGEIQNIMNQSLECSKNIGFAEHTFLKILGTNSVRDLCINDISKGVETIENLNQFEAGNISHQEMITNLNHAAYQFSLNSEQLEPLVDRTVATLYYLTRILHEMEGESCSKAFDICVTKRFLENTVCNCMYLKKRSQNVVKIREKMIAKEYNTNFKFI